jgi:hypothetical protein
MEHVVFFPAADGSPSFRRVPSLDEAVRLVEHLRNVEGLSTVSVHSLTEVPLAFRAYYRVEVPSAAAPTAPVQAVGAAALGAVPAQHVPTPVPAVAPAGLVLVEDLDAGERPVAAQDPEPGEAAHDAHHGHDAREASDEPVLSTPASLGFFA